MEENDVWDTETLALLLTMVMEEFPHCSLNEFVDVLRTAASEVPKSEGKDRLRLHVRKLLLTSNLGRADRTGKQKPN